MTLKPSEHAEAMHERLDKGGWCKGTWGASQCEVGGVCLEGANHYVLTRLDLGSIATVANEVTKAVLAKATEAYPDRLIPRHSMRNPVPLFNDHEETTKEDVLDVVMSVAKQFRNEGR